MKKKQQLKIDEVLIEELRDLTLGILEHLKVRNQKPDFDFERAEEIINRIFHNELDYLATEPDNYFEIYLN